MLNSLSRRQILTANVKGQPDVLRPPWAVDAFESKCDACGDCASACPQNILRSDGAGLPFVDFSHSFCDFCGECVSSCKTGALVNSKQPWQAEAAISGQCLAVQGIVCRSCEENCDETAISFRLGLNGRSYPLIDEKTCNGCGECVAPCPVQAISIQTKQMEEIHA